MYRYIFYIKNDWKLWKYDRQGHNTGINKIIYSN